MLVFLSLYSPLPVLPFLCTPFSLYSLFSACAPFACTPFSLYSLFSVPPLLVLPLPILPFLYTPLAYTPFSLYSLFSILPLPVLLFLYTPLAYTPFSLYSFCLCLLCLHSSLYILCMYSLFSKLCLPILSDVMMAGNNASALITVIGELEDLHRFINRQLVGSFSFHLYKPEHCPQLFLFTGLVRFAPYSEII